MKALLTTLLHCQGFEVPTSLSDVRFVSLDHPRLSGKKRKKIPWISSSLVSVREKTEKLAATSMLCFVAYTTWVNVFKRSNKTIASLSGLEQLVCMHCWEVVLGTKEQFQPFVSLFLSVRAISGICRAIKSAESVQCEFSCLKIVCTVGIQFCHVRVSWVTSSQ